ncbi:MAG: YfcE family phosphodiesterase [Desulfobacteraceae bacterium]|nr:YfcE family phosphodiesterase [Desulfobacteraceae bacterium]
MTKLIITADIHGSLIAWQTIKNLLNPDDRIAIAGDLFDTKYGNTSHTDFQPESIKKDLKSFKHSFYYVYGNCDIPAFYPGFKSSITFNVFNKKILLYHGHRSNAYCKDIDIIIQGHTHLCHLEKKGGHIFMNPGSITCPRNDYYTYGIIDNTSASLIELKTGHKLVTINF